jgi:haloalkane dehalogenase
MKCLRTPDDRFTDLPDFPFEPCYAEIDDEDGGRLRVHYLDQGPPGGQTVLLLHGEPTWSFLYRKMIPVLVQAGRRVVAPDLVGFGRSDKPARREDYTYNRHVAWMRNWLDQVDLRRITLVCQDWGGLIGLRLVAAAPERFARVVVANTGLPTGEHRMSDAFMAWRKFSRETPVFDVGRIVAGGCRRALPDEVIAAYEAPFPDESYKEGARIFPSLVPTEPDAPGAAENRQAWQALRRFDRPFLTAFSDGDPITRGGEAVFQKLIPGAQGRRHTTIKDAGHFLQEDQGPELARVVIEFMTATAG